jgi:DNA-binding response OmpR family regulator
LFHASWAKCTKQDLTREFLLNDDAHEFVVDGQRIGLSPLEYGVLRYLIDGDGRAVSREELLRGVWGSEYTGWSNKVDAVVAGLRSKLGNQAKSIETVRGIGYRFNG